VKDILETWLQTRETPGLLLLQMNILFVYKGPDNPIIEAQANSLDGKDVVIYRFPLKVNTPASYILEYARLIRFLLKHKIDLIHAHYSYSGIIAGITFKKTICSLMGSDVFNQHWLIFKLTHFFHKYVWSATIVKSDAMRDIFFKSVSIPNGVNLGIFKPLERSSAIRKTNLKQNKKNIIFVVEKIHRNSKNFKLAKLTFEKYFDNSKVELTLVTDKPQLDLVYYYNAADVFLLTSGSEGSPNTIKEAMACNCPIVSTDVGDVKKVIGNIKGCYISSHEPIDIAMNLKAALEFNNKTLGRERIIRLGLDSDTIAGKLVEIYKRQIKEKIAV
jgi:glycosyltransferase involved in cell wall biosynthesis